MGLLSVKEKSLKKEGRIHGDRKRRLALHFLRSKLKPEESFASKNCVRRTLPVTCNNLNCKMMKRSCQSSTMLKIVNLRHERRKLIRSITLKIFIKQTQGNDVTDVRKQLRPKC